MYKILITRMTLKKVFKKGHEVCNKIKELRKKPRDTMKEWLGLKIPETERQRREGEVLPKTKFGVKVKKEMFMNNNFKSDGRDLEDSLDVWWKDLDNEGKKKAKEIWKSWWKKWKKEEGPFRYDATEAEMEEYAELRRIHEEAEQEENWLNYVQQ